MRNGFRPMGNQLAGADRDDPLASPVPVKVERLSPAERIRHQRQVSAQSDRLDQYREQWLNKQIECEELQRRLSVISGALRERLAQTECGCGHPACNRCEDDKWDRFALEEDGA